MSTTVLAAQAGSLDAFEQLVIRWQGVVCAIGLSILHDVQALSLIHI